jgi:hypothetical protein
MTQIILPLHRKDIETIVKILEENNIHAFNLIGDGYESGIGYTLDLEFDSEYNGRMATIKINVTDEGDW